MTGATVAANVPAPAVRGSVDGGAGLGEAWVAEGLPSGLGGGESSLSAMRDYRALFLSEGSVQVQPSTRSATETSGPGQSGLIEAIVSRAARQISFASRLKAVTSADRPP